MTLTEIVTKITEANIAYRIGDAIISDTYYDQLVEKLLEIDPTHPLLAEIGHVPPSRKVKLDIEMASMDKIKSIGEFHGWCDKKGISPEEELISTPKYDGISLNVNEDTNAAKTRGDGEYGQQSDAHYVKVNNHLIAPDEMSPSFINYTYGEVVMKKDIFLSKYAETFANSRNMIAGLFNNDDATEPLKDCDYIKYGAIVSDQAHYTTKREILDTLNNGSTEKVEYHICKVKDVTEKLLLNLFELWSTTYDIDGIILEVNNLERQTDLGRETSTANPCWARAFKHPSFEDSAETKVTGITWGISKQGKLKPVIHINPVHLNGVTVSNVTGNNARFIKEMGIGVGSIVVVRRSGMVIPIIASVTTKVDFTLPNIPNIKWDENKVELITENKTDTQLFKQIVSFFEIIGTDNVGEGVVKQLWDNGYDSLKKILNMTASDMEKLEGFGKRKASIVYNSISKSLVGIRLSKLQHATGIFGGNLGSRKLALLEHFTKKPSIEEVSAIEGFGELSAIAYVDNYENFFTFIDELPISFIVPEQVVVDTNSKLTDKVFVFSGIRLPDIENEIIRMGGKVSNSVSKNTNYLVLKTVGSGSSKEVKATNLGVKIINVEQMRELLK